MAQSNIEVLPTKRDRALAAQANLIALLRRTDQMGDPAFSDFVRQNYPALKPSLKRHAPDIFQPDTDPEQALAVIRKVIGKLTPAAIDEIDYKALGLKKIQAEEFARKRFEREVARAMQKEDAKKKARLALFYMGQSILAPVKLLSSPIHAAANVLGAALDSFGMSQKARYAAFGILASTNVGLAAMPVDATPYAAKMGSVQKVFHDACTPAILKGSGANAAYAIHFNSLKPHSIERHVHDTMILAAHHGVPAIALHAIGYFESVRFTDNKADNSSASNYFMTIKGTQIRNMRTYGKDLIDYGQGVERIEAGTATLQDKSLVKAIDAIYTLGADDLERMVRQQKYPGYVHDALVKADVNGIAVQLIAMDLAAKKPELLNPALNARDIADIVTDYYAEHHFLGMGNYRLLNTIAIKHPKISITDQKSIKSLLGDDTNRRLQQIVESNPGLLKDGMTGSEALNSIKTKFRAYIDPVMRDFEKIHNPNATSYDYCLTDEARRGDIPKTISNYRAIGYSYGFDVDKLGAAFYAKATGMLQPGQKIALEPETEIKKPSPGEPVMASLVRKNAPVPPPRPRNL